MKTTIAYVTEDGKRFFDKEAAERWERESADVAAILPSEVEEPGPGCRFANGAHYRQHPQGTRDALFAACKDSPYPHPRIADDSGTPWYRAWGRWMSMDEQDREWGQPYFANHPNAEATPI